MQTVDEQPLETIHLYVVREDQKKSQTLLPVILSVLCLLSIVVVTVYSANNPYYEHETLRIPAVFLPVKTFSANEPIIPTGSKTYPATRAHGTLTIYNGSILSQELPTGMILAANSGVEVVTDKNIYIPSGNPPYYGVASVSAHAVVSGTQGNINAWSINQVYGTSLYIRNLTAFRGGKNSYSVKVETAQDRQTAMDAARVSLTAQVAHIKAFLAFPCSESSQEKNGAITLTLACQFVTYSVPPYMRITHIKLVGKNLLVDVVFVARPRIIQFK